MKTLDCREHMKIHDLASLIRAIFNDALNKDKPQCDRGFALRTAIEWLCRAQDSTPDKGVSEGYHLLYGWLPSYPETTGYIIESFFNYAQVMGNESLNNRAIAMADWLVSIQNEDGSIPDSYLKNKMVFDTGQVIFGFLRTYEETKKAQYLDAATKAGDWLVDVQEEDGTWKKYAVGGIAHTYYTRVAWSLAFLYHITNEEKYIKGCIKNIDWAISQQQENGWFNNASFRLNKHEHPFTHTIAYTIRGILESGLYLKNDEYISSALKAIGNFIGTISDDGQISGYYDCKWRCGKSFSCLTGDAQIAVILLRLYEEIGNIEYFVTAGKINKYLMKRQELRIRNMNVFGAIAGSFPIWGDYIHFAYPNWACKFFIDSLMLEAKLDNLKK